MTNRCLSTHVLETLLSVPNGDPLQLQLYKEKGINCLFASGDSCLMLLFTCQLLKHLLGSVAQVWAQQDPEGTWSWYKRQKKDICLFRDTTRHKSKSKPTDFSALTFKSQHFLYLPSNFLSLEPLQSFLKAYVSLSLTSAKSASFYSGLMAFCVKDGFK